MNDQTASVNVIRAQIERGKNVMGPCEAGYTTQQKAWLVTMDDRLASRLEHRRERIALAILVRGQISDGRLDREIQAVELVLDQLERENG